MPDPNQIPYSLSISAPEILYADERDRTNLRLMPNDVFCLGTSIGFCRVTDRTSGEDRVNTMIAMLEGFLLDEVPPETNSLNHLMMRCVHLDPEERATIQQILEHPYLNSDHPFLH